MKFEINKETLVKVGDGAWRLTKHIVKKGIQTTVMETAGSVTMAALEGDKSKVKERLQFDAIVGPKKVKIKTDKPKKKWFGKKGTEELVEQVTDEEVSEKLREAAELIEAEGE